MFKLKVKGSAHVPTRSVIVNLPRTWRTRKSEQRALIAFEIDLRVIAVALLVENGLVILVVSELQEGKNEIAVVIESLEIMRKFGRMFLRVPPQLPKPKRLQLATTSQR
jgi:hypothetical protein